MVRCLARLLMVLVPLGAVAGTDERPVERPDALLVNVTEADLNRILVGSFHANGGPVFEGTRPRVSAAMADLRYEARLSDPVLRLAPGARASLSFDIEEANLSIGRIQRKIAGRMASCEGTSLSVDPAKPLQVEMDLSLEIANGDLRLVPASVSVPDAENRLSLGKPTSCSHAPLPRWLLWWIGKPYLKRYVQNLDEVLLDRARKSATRIDGKRDFLHKDWEISGQQVHLFPSAIDTSRGSLLLSLAASSAPPGPRPSTTAALLDLPTDRSFVALSEAFTNEAVRLAASRMSVERLRPTGNLSKLVRSGSVYALIPGLRGLAATDKLLYSVVFRSAPRVEFETAAGGEARIRLLVSGIELRLFKESANETTFLGALEVESGRIGVVPFVSVLGGVSFRIEENAWHVSSKGIRFDDSLVAATLQEVTFGRIFETTYRPLGPSRFKVAQTEFVPRAFDAVGDYLVIELGTEDVRPDERVAGAPLHTGILPGARP